jgi:hypothetical protein
VLNSSVPASYESSVARDLAVRFPEVHDGYDRLGMAVGKYEFRAAS